MFNGSVDGSILSREFPVPWSMDAKSRLTGTLIGPATRLQAKGLASLCVDR